jgi:hypothetical protein
MLSALIIKIQQIFYIVQLQLRLEIFNFSKGFFQVTKHVYTLILYL